MSANREGLMKADWRKNMVVAHIALEDSPPLGSVLDLENEAGERVSMRYTGGSCQGDQIMIWGPEVKIQPADECSA